MATANYTQFDYWFSVASETLELIDIIWDQEHKDKINSDCTCSHYEAISYFYDLISEEARKSIFNCRDELHEYYKKRYYVVRLTEGLDGLPESTKTARFWLILKFFDKINIYRDIHEQQDVGRDYKKVNIDEMDCIFGTSDDTEDLDIYL